MPGATVTDGWHRRGRKMGAARYLRVGLTALVIREADEARHAAASPPIAPELLRRGKAMLCAGADLCVAAKKSFAVGTLVTSRPPPRSVRAAFPHTAPTSGIDGSWLPETSQCPAALFPCLA